MIKRNILNKADSLLSTLLILVFSLILVFGIISIKIPESRILPIVSLLIAGASCIGQFISLFKKSEKDTTWQEIVFKKKEVFIIFLLFVAYFLIEILGFYFTLFILAFVLMLIVQNKVGAKQIKIAFIYSLLLTLVSYFGFAVILQLVTPTGLII